MLPPFGFFILNQMLLPRVCSVKGAPMIGATVFNLQPKCRSPPSNLFCEKTDWRKM